MSASDPFKTFNAMAKKRHWACQIDPTLTFEHNELNAVARLWLDRAWPHAIPARTAFDARTLKPFLSNMTLLERAPKGRYRLRLHGTRLTRYAGDHTGKFVDDLIPPAMVECYNELYDFVLREKRPVRVLWDYQVPVISYLRGENFVAPLAASDGSVNLLLSVTYVDAKQPQSVAAA